MLHWKIDCTPSYNVFLEFLISNVISVHWIRTADSVEFLFLSIFGERSITALRSSTLSKNKRRGHNHAPHLHLVLRGVYTKSVRSTTAVYCPRGGHTRDTCTSSTHVHSITVLLNNYTFSELWSTCLYTERQKLSVPNSSFVSNRLRPSCAPLPSAWSTSTTREFTNKQALASHSSTIHNKMLSSNHSKCVVSPFFYLWRLHCFEHSDRIQQTNLWKGKRIQEIVNVGVSGVKTGEHEG